MLPLSDMISDDMGLMDGAEAVIVADRAGSWAVPVADAIPRMLSLREVARSDGAYRAGDVRIHAKASLFAAAPKPGDVVTRADASVAVVVGVDTATLATRYALITRGLKIEGATTVEAELFRSANRESSTGAIVLDHIATGVSYTAQMQPMDVPAIEEADDGRERPAQTWRLYLPTMPMLDTGDAFRIDGTFYRWKASADAARIDMLPSVDLEELPL